MRVPISCDPTRGKYHLTRHLKKNIYRVISATSMLDEPSPMCEEAHTHGSKDDPLLLILTLAGGCAPRTRPAKAPVSTGAPLPPMQKALADYRQIAAKGGWVTVPDGPPLVKGEIGERVALLRKRLSTTDDLTKGKGSDVFDDDLEAAVQRFQVRHGLEPDGTVAKETLAAL